MSLPTRPNKADNLLSLANTTIVITGSDARINYTCSDYGQVIAEITQNPNDFITKVETSHSNIVREIRIYINRFQDGGKINVQVEETTNYKASNIVEVTVSSQYIKALNDCELDEIVTLSGVARTKNVWHVGDYKTFEMAIPISNVDGVVVSKKKRNYRAVIIGFNHNFDVENNGKTNYVDFMITDNDGMPLLFNNYDYGAETERTSTYGGQEVKNFHWHGSFIAMIDYLPDVIKNNSSVQKMVWNDNQGEIQTYVHPSAVAEDFSVAEVLGSPSESGCAQYEYFANGNTLPNTDKKIWSRKLGQNGSNIYGYYFSKINSTW